MITIFCWVSVWIFLRRTFNNMLRSMCIKLLVWLTVAFRQAFGSCDSAATLSCIVVVFCSAIWPLENSVPIPASLPIDWHWPWPMWSSCNTFSINWCISGQLSWSRLTLGMVRSSKLLCGYWCWAGEAFLVFDIGRFNIESIEVVGGLPRVFGVAVTPISFCESIAAG